MKFLKFRIQNFKGIKDCTISLDNSKSNIFSLIGLNESGKTTILEAINYLVAADSDIAALYKADLSDVPLTSLVPKDRKLNFNDEISITATIEMDGADIKEFQKEFKKSGYEINTSNIKTVLNVVQYFAFESSNLKNSGRRWDSAFYAKTNQQKVFKEVSTKSPLWQDYYTTFRRLLPQICYFPTFLFDLPDKIYLEPTPEEKPPGVYYRRLFQDILDSLNQGLTIQDHVVSKIRHTTSVWSWARYMMGDRKEQVDHVILKASGKVTSVIMDSWKRVFGKSYNRRIEFEHQHDQDLDAVYLRIYLIDGDQKYDISERSLGFRWFFCFWLFTYFRTLRSDGGRVLFLLDEPASNLHATAQEELLSNFVSLISERSTVMYSTHSHYLINPRWLDSAYIISNSGVNVGAIEDEFSQSGETDIKALRYKDFVGKHPNQRTYFLPVLDALEYRPSELAIARPSVLVEGKCDFAFFKTTTMADSGNISFIPGNGAKSLDPVISILTGWGIPFVILLDDDKEGKDAKKKYVDNWALDDGVVKTIADFDLEFAGKSLEKVIMETSASAIKEHFSISHVEKIHVQAYIYEILSTGANPNYAEQLKQLQSNVYNWANENLKVNINS